MENLAGYIVVGKDKEIYKIKYMKERRNPKGTRESLKVYVAEASNGKLVTLPVEFEYVKKTLMKLSEKMVSSIGEQLLVRCINSIRKIYQEFGKGIYMEDGQLYHNGKKVVDYSDDSWVADCDKLNSILNWIKNNDYGVDDKNIYRCLDSERYQTYKTSGNRRGMFFNGRMEMVYHEDKILSKMGLYKKYLASEKKQHTLYKLKEGSYIAYGQEDFHKRYGHIEKVVVCRKAKPRFIGYSDMELSDFISEFKLTDEEIREISSQSRCSIGLNTSVKIDDLEKVYLNKNNKAFETIPYFKLGEEEIYVQVKELVKDDEGEKYVIVKKILDKTKEEEKMISDTISHALTTVYLSHNLCVERKEKYRL